jgi:phosphate transport system protein
MARGHTDASFDAELERLEESILRMGRVVEEQIGHAIEAIRDRDNDLASRIVAKDEEINGLEEEVDRHTIRLLSLRQPMGIDLRNIMAATKIATDLERIADYAANVARHIPDLNSVSVPSVIESIVSMAEIAKDMLKDILAAYRNPDMDGIIEVWHRDDRIDEIYPRVLTDLREFMKTHPKKVESCTSLIFVGRSVERIGDHITNIAEQIHYILKGELYRGERTG